MLNTRLMSAALVLFIVVCVLDIWNALTTMVPA